MRTLALLLLVVPTVLAAGGSTGPQDAEEPDRARVVIALIEFAGTNPYHVDFRRDAQTAHPSTYIDGYPADATPLRLSLDAPDYDAALASDAAVWNSYTPRQLHYIPGTNIIGMLTWGSGTGLDTGGHGAGTSSLAAGTDHGMAPEADLVILNGDLFGTFFWASQQDWIDVVSISLGTFLGTCTVGICDPVDVCTGNPFLPVRLVNRTRMMFERDAWPFSAAGYGCGSRVGETGVSYPGQSITSFISGPSWVESVGTFQPHQEQAEYGGAYPVDVLSQAGGYTAAAAGSMTAENAFGNASGAVPLAAGLYAAMLHYARSLLGDTHEVHPAGIVARAPPGTDQALPGSGPLADGILTFDEARRVYHHSATPVDVLESHATHGDHPHWSQGMLPALPYAEFVTQGYGLVTRDSLDRAMRILDGRDLEPLRPADDAWYATTQALRDALWVPIDAGHVYVL